MARTKGGLFSVEASGKFGSSIVYDKRGFARVHVTPANPQTPAQGNVRQMLLGVQKALTFLGTMAIDAVKTVAPVTYRWNSFLLSEVLGVNSSEFDASVLAYAALAPAERALWEDEALSLGLVPQEILYASDAPMSPGLALFAISRALFRLGLNVAAGAPGAANADEYRAYIAA